MTRAERIVLRTLVALIVAPLLVVGDCLLFGGRYRVCLSGSERTEVSLRYGKDGEHVFLRGTEGCVWVRPHGDATLLISTKTPASAARARIASARVA